MTVEIKLIFFRRLWNEENVEDEEKFQTNRR